MNASYLPELPGLSHQQTTELEADLKKELLSLSYLAFQVLVRRLLQQMGYSRVQGLGRQHKRGRTKVGGSDLSASIEAGVTRSVILLQIKQYDRPVSRRFVDELRGACLRMGAEQGMLFTTSTFSRPAWKAAEGPSHSIRLVEGTELLQLLIEHRVGVNRDGITPLSVDTPLFERLRSQYPVPTIETPPPAITPEPNSPLSTQNIVTESGDDFTWRTHVLGGVGAAWLLLWLLFPLSGSLLLGMALLGGFGALLPDLDAPGSRVSMLKVINLRPLLPLSRWLNRRWGHRGPLHSWIGVLTVTLIAASLVPLVGPSAAALPLGYSSHLLLDSCTRTGVPIFYPRRRRYFLLPRSLRLTTGSAAEEVILVLVALGLLALLLLHLSQFFSPSAI